MKRVLIVFVAFFLFVSFISADVVIVNQPSELYGTGEIASFAVKANYNAVSGGDPYVKFRIQLVCNNVTLERHNEDIFSGEDKLIEVKAILIKSVLGNTVSSCKFNTILGSTTVSSNQFRVSDRVAISMDSSEKEYAPEDKITLTGTASKGNNVAINGVAEFVFSDGKKVTEDVKDGAFSVESEIDKNQKAGTYTVQLNVYEKDFLGEKTVSGENTFSYSVKQVPRNLELVLDKTELLPSDTVKIKTILHDQTGDNIKQDVSIQILNSSGSVVDTRNIATGSETEYTLKERELPSVWKVTTSFGELSDDKSFEVLRQEKIETAIINNTLILKNLGNVAYNKSINVTIGGKVKEVKVELDVNGEDTFFLYAPKGSYDIIISSGDGYTNSVGGVALTGRAIDVRKTSQGAISFVSKPIVWIFIIVIILALVYFTLKKGYQRSFFGRIYTKKTVDFDNDGKKLFFNRSNDDEDSSTNVFTNPVEKAKMQQSVDGEKQEAVFVSLKIKNINEILADKTNSKETLNELTNIADGFKASTCEAHDNLLFILAPVRTKTFDNEALALKLAKSVQDKIISHNKLYRQKIAYGISISKGSILAKYANKVLNFTNIGNSVLIAKKLATVASEAIVMTEAIRNKLLKEIIVKKKSGENGLEYFSLEEIKENSQKREAVNEMFRKMNTSSRSSLN